MPRINKSTTSQQSAAPYPVPEVVLEAVPEAAVEEAAEPGHRYGTRRMAYKFSKSKAPVIPPPAATQGATSPASVNCTEKRPYGNKGAGAAVTAANETGEGNAATCSQADQIDQGESQPEQRELEQHNLEVPNSGPLPFNTPGSAVVHADDSHSGSIPQIGHLPQLPTISEDTTTPSTSQDMSTALVLRNTQGNQAASITTSSTLFSTPRRPNRPVGFNTPALVIIQNSQDWTQSNHDDLQIAPFIPNPSIPLDTSVLSISVSPHPNSRQICIQQSGFSSWMPRESEFAPPQSGASLNTPSKTHTAMNFNQDVFQAQPTRAIEAPPNQFKRLYDTIMGTIPPVLPTAPMTPAPNALANPRLLQLPQGPPSAASSRESSILRDEPVPAQALHASRVSSTSRASSAAPEAGHGSNDTWRSSVAPSSFQLSRAYLPPASRPPGYSNGYRPNSLRQGNFTYEQVIFIKYMKYRWAFSLATEDPFPINVLPAREACFSYAEKTLEVSRTSCQLSQVFDYVRKKDSGIRNSFLNGLLLAVEESYDVNTTSGLKIDDLISNMNFAHASWDKATRKIVGRYRNPCIAKVIKIVLFTKRSRGRSIGVRFIRELMGDPEELDVTTHTPMPTIGAPVATIGLACTLILHALHSIKAGDSSSRKRDTPKPVKLSESKYGKLYRTILAKLKQYERLGEVKELFMEEIMKEYLVAQAASDDGSDGDELEFDDEMQSDGE
ncbi:hypothetical protein FRC08_002612 [Ceratobasidium sp. 394]|nr:hypothetical protein FRC08_002612 [Ceratobasidium sp. 394]